MKSSMSKRLLVAAFIVGFALPARTEPQTRAQLNTQNNSTITTNGHGAITGAIINSMNSAFIQSGGMQNDANSWSGPNTATGPWTFNGAMNFASPPGPRGNLNVGNFASPQDYGCVENGVADCSAAANIAAAITNVTGQKVNVYSRSGQYLYNSPVFLNNGQKFYCDGVGSTFIKINGNFNRTANGAVVLSGRGNTPNAVQDCAFQFAQPADVSTTAAATAVSSSTITVNSISSNVSVGNVVYDRAAIGHIPNQTTVTSISGSGPYTIGVSNLSSVTSGDTIGFAQARNQYETLAAAGTACGVTIGCKYPAAIYSLGGDLYTISDIACITAWDCINGSTGSTVTWAQASVTALSYNTMTGVISLTFGSSPFTNLTAATTANGLLATINGISGTGGLPQGAAPLNGAWPITGTSSGGTVLTLQGPIGLGSLTLAANGALAPQVVGNGGGGLMLHDLQIEALNNGIYVDQHFNPVQITNLQCLNTGSGFTVWGPYGDSTMNCQRLGRVDGLTESNVVSFLSGTTFAATAGNSEDMWVFNGWVEDGGFIIDQTTPNAHTVVINGGSLQAGGFGITETTPILTVTGQLLYANGFQLGDTSSSATTTNPIQVTGGGFNCSNCRLENDGVNAGIVNITGGSLSLFGSQLVNHNASAASVAANGVVTCGTPPMVSQASTGTVNISAGTSFGGGSGAPCGISISVQNASNYVQKLNWGNYILVMNGFLGATDGHLLLGPGKSDTYFPTPGASTVRFKAAGGGGGGGGGSEVTSGTATSGGGGGGGASIHERILRTQDLVTTGIAISVGLGGTHGVGSTTASTAGGNGGAGGNTVLATTGISAFGGGGAAGGQIGAVSAGASAGGWLTAGANTTGSTAGGASLPGAAGAAGAQAGTNTIYDGAGAGSGSSIAGVAFPSGNSLMSGPGGPSGGGVTTAATGNNGGTGACPFEITSATQVGGTSVSPNGGTLANGPSYLPGCAGGGGYGNPLGNGGNGGVSGQTAGGAGGGSTINGNTGGNGSDGGGGYAIIDEY